MASFTPDEASEAIEVAPSEAADEAELAAFSTIFSGFGTPAIPTSSVSKTILQHQTPGEKSQSRKYAPNVEPAGIGPIARSP